ncbi:unnamed protein product [Diamesa serratosioi]
MNNKLIILCVVLAVSLVNGETTTKPTGKDNVICKKCNCIAKTKTIDCSNKSLSKLFTDDEWKTFNAAEDVYEILKLDHNQFVNVDVVFPVLKSPFKVIDLSHNKIASISPKVFMNLKYIEELDLSYNTLTSEFLKPEVFEGKYDPDMYEPLKPLRKLKLSFNLIHTLHPDVFEHTPNLQVLQLDNNPFQMLSMGVLTAFSSVPLLQELDLSYIEISDIPEETFHPLRNLMNLKLAGNLFKTIPKALKYAINVNFLTLDENPLGDMNELNPMPTMKKLETLSLTYIAPMKMIGKGAISGMESLKTLHLCNNHHLEYIHPDAFTFPEKDNTERLQWPPVRSLFLQSNNLTAIDSNMFVNWNEMKEIHIHDNPWMCDCENQWLIDDLIPILKVKTTHLINNIKCAFPHPMVDMKLLDLNENKSHMRCLDKYGNNPQTDSAVLVALLVGVIAGIPLAFAAILLWKRGCFGVFRQGPADFSRAFYKRADSQENAQI